MTVLVHLNTPHSYVFFGSGGVNGRDFRTGTGIVEGSKGITMQGFFTVLKMQDTYVRILR